MLIYLNKSAISGPNGDSMMLMSFMNDTVNKKLDNWTYPKLNSYSSESSSLNPNGIEIIEICSYSFN